MKTYNVSCMVTISMSAQVQATSRAKAIAIAEGLDLPRLCHQCGGSRENEGGGMWELDEIDGEPFEVTVRLDK